MTSSLSRPVSSSGVMTSCCHRFELRLLTPHGLVLLFEVGARPPHDGMRRMGRYNLTDGLAANQRQDRRSLRTHPTRRPREDIFLPKQNALSPCLQFLRRRFRQPQEPGCCPCSSGTRYRRPTSGAEPRPDAWRPRRSLDASRVAERLARPTPSATTIFRCG
jgi:hypothetical protein